MHHFRQNPMPEDRIETPSSTPCFPCGSQGLDRAREVHPQLAWVVPKVWLISTIAISPVRREGV
jgi:hypothetical protein